LHELNTEQALTNILDYREEMGLPLERQTPRITDEITDQMNKKPAMILQRDR
jgi:hypothetical protein